MVTGALTLSGHFGAFRGRLVPGRGGTADRLSALRREDHLSRDLA